MSGSILIRVGDPAPDFDLLGSDGARHRLSEVLRTHHALLLFYPGDDTPG